MPKGNKLIRSTHVLYYKVRRGLRKWFIEPLIRKSFAEYGHNIRIPAGCTFSGLENIFVGNNVIFGCNTRILTTKAKLIIGNHVMFGPGVTIVTGNHRTDVLGKYMCAITDADKRPEDDQDIIIKDDVWIGSNAIILKGVTIGQGSIIAAGAVVTKSFPPYSIIGGNPAKLLRSRFNENEIKQHEQLLSQEKG